MIFMGLVLIHAAGTHRFLIGLAIKGVIVIVSKTLLWHFVKCNILYNLDRLLYISLIFLLHFHYRFHLSSVEWQTLFFV